MSEAEEVLLEAEVYSTRPTFESLAALDDDPLAPVNSTSIQSIVTMPEGKGSIYKSTLVSMLNDDPKVSADR